LLQGKPVCVALNKRDLVASSQAPGEQRQQAQESSGQSLEQQVQELQRGLEAAGEQPQQPQLLVVHTSAVTGAGMQQLAEWLGGGFRCVAAQQGQRAAKACNCRAVAPVAPAPG
jgi:translation initiation factor IF-2